MAEYSRNGIYTYVRNALLEEFPGLYITAANEPIPPEHYAVRIYQINAYSPIRNVTLAGDDGQYKVAFDINVYTDLHDDGTERVYDIMNVAMGAMKELYFILTDCIPVERANNRVTRLTARFERQIGLGDQMPVTGMTGTTGMTGMT